MVSSFATTSTATMARSRRDTFGWRIIRDISPYPAREKEKSEKRESAMFVCNRYRCQVFCNFCPTALKEAMQIGQMACARGGPSSEVKNTVAGTMGKKFLRHAKKRVPCGSLSYPWKAGYWQIRILYDCSSFARLSRLLDIPTSFVSNCTFYASIDLCWIAMHFLHVVANCARNNITT